MCLIVHIRCQTIFSFQTRFSRITAKGVNYGWGGGAGGKKNWGEIRPYCAYLLPTYSENLRDHKNTVKTLVVSFKMVLTNRCQNIEKCPGTLMLSNCSIILRNVLVPPRLHKESIFERALNMHSRWSTEQHSCVLEPYRGCHQKGKKVRARTPSLNRANRAINMHSRRPTEP